MSVKQKYLKDENGEVFSPIVSATSVYYDTTNDIQPKCCLATFDKDKTITVNTSWGNNKISLDYGFINIGNGFTINDGCIYIGSGIKYVRVSAALGVWTSPDTNEITLSVQQKRGSNVVKNFAADSTKVVGLIGLSIPNCIFNVQEGDYIELGFSTASTGNYSFIGRGTNTYVFIEKIC